MQPAEQNNVFDRWMTEHSGILHHVARGFAAGEDAHDLMQELMLAVWRAIPVYRTEAKVSTFVYRVAHHAALTWKRSQRNYRGRVDRFEAQAHAIERDVDAKSAREKETLDWLYARIRELAPVERSLILLHLDGVSYAEIAELHGLSESNVGTRLTRLKQRLSDAMKEVSDELR
jgi:RNA polymerase sigma factor (sigma-70 family)